jgi:hypothetical protein
MTLFGIGLILGGCALLASAFVGANRARRAERFDEHEEPDHRPRHPAPPRIQRSALLAKTLLLNVVRVDSRGSQTYRSRAHEGPAKDVAARDVVGRGRRDPYRRNPPSPPPPARRLAQIVTRENAPVRQPPRR